MADVKPLINYAGKIKQIAAVDKIPLANLATGTPTGTKFIRDDGTLQAPLTAAESAATRVFNYSSFI